MSESLARVGKALASRPRAAMVGVLMDGAEHPAGELADAAGVASSTASEHLAILVETGIASVEVSGRRRLFRLADPRVAHALEQLSMPDLPVPRSLRMTREQRRVRAARTCYDHLAGQLGVALAERFVSARWVDLPIAAVTSAGREALCEFFAIEEADLRQPPRSRRPTVRACRDWTEQRDHLAGLLGARIADTALARDWVRRKDGSRALIVTARGHRVLERAGVEIEAP